MATITEFIFLDVDSARTVGVSHTEGAHVAHPASPTRFAAGALSLGTQRVRAVAL
jgi:hypothetical protein